MKELSGLKCSLCGSTSLYAFYQIANVPASCNQLWDTKDEAINCAKGDIKLAFCSTCTFISNVAIEPEKNLYGDRYDNSLFFSSHFQEFAQKMSANLIQRFNLREKRIVEISGGKVDFLSFLKKLGNNYGLTLDPYQIVVNGKSQRRMASSALPMNAADVFDFIFSYHELEHINSPKDFLISLNKMFRNSQNVRYFFAVPHSLKAFEEGDFSDIIYEHVSYFTIPALRRLFSSAGFGDFEISVSRNEIFDSIYISASPINQVITPKLESVGLESDKIKKSISLFATLSSTVFEKISSNVKQLLDAGNRVVMWGAGARGVTLLNVLNDKRIEYAVDINPCKQGKFIPGTGQKIISPESLLQHVPDYIILANPAYKEEIGNLLGKIGLSPHFILT